jgi:hypothetical protein
MLHYVSSKFWVLYYHFLYKKLLII